MGEKQTDPQTHVASVVSESNFELTSLHLTCTYVAISRRYKKGWAVWQLYKGYYYSLSCDLIWAAQQSAISHLNDTQILRRPLLERVQRQ
jgi:hypothetical protein